MQWKVLQAGGSYTHVGKTLAPINPRLAAPHSDPHLNALCCQWQEGSLRFCGEGCQRLSNCSSQGVSEAECKLICVPSVFLLTKLIAPCCSRVRGMLLSPEVRNAIHVGDRILEINGLPVGTMMEGEVSVYLTHISDTHECDECDLTTYKRS